MEDLVAGDVRPRAAVEPVKNRSDVLHRCVIFRERCQEFLQQDDLAFCLTDMRFVFAAYTDNSRSA